MTTTVPTTFSVWPRLGQLLCHFARETQCRGSWCAATLSRFARRYVPAGIGPASTTDRPTMLKKFATPRP